MFRVVGLTSGFPVTSDVHDTSLVLRTEKVRTRGCAQRGRNFPVTTGEKGDIDKLRAEILN